MKGFKMKTRRGFLKNALVALGVVLVGRFPSVEFNDVIWESITHPFPPFSSGFIYAPYIPIFELVEIDAVHSYSGINKSFFTSGILEKK